MTRWAIFLLSAASWAQGIPFNANGMIHAAAAGSCCTFSAFAVGGLVNGTSQSNIATTTASVTLTTGQSVLGCVRYSNVSQTVTSLVDNISGSPNTYTLGTPVTDGNSTLTCGWGVNLTGGSNVVWTWNFSGNSNFIGTCLHVVTGATAIDLHPTPSNATGGTTTQTSNAFTTTAANEYIFAADSLETTNVTYTAGNIGGSAATLQGTASLIMGCEYRAVTSIQTSQTATFTSSATNDWEMGVLTLK